MTNIFKCVTCNETITAEETKIHHCKPRITKYKTIEATSYFTVKNDKGEECIVIDALNGIGYTYVMKKPNLMPLSEGLTCDLETPILNSEKNYDKTPTDDQNWPSKHLLFENGKFC